MKVVIQKAEVDLGIRRLSRRRHEPLLGCRKPHQALNAIGLQRAWGDHLKTWWAQQLLELELRVSFHLRIIDGLGDLSKLGEGLSSGLQCRLQVMKRSACWRWCDDGLCQ